MAMEGVGKADLATLMRVYGESGWRGNAASLLPEWILGRLKGQRASAGMQLDS